MSGEDAGTSRSEPKMEMHNSNNFCTRQFRASNNLKSIENRLSPSGMFPRTYVSGNLPQGPKESARSKR